MRKKSPQQQKEEQKNKRLLKTYGITLKEYKEMVAFQGNLCMICLAKPVHRSLNIDHRHVKGYKKLSQGDKKKEVRGLLCFSCNTLLGKVEHRKDCRRILQNVLWYFKRYKMKGE